MERFKRIALRLIFLPGWLVWLISLPSFALVIYVLATGLKGSTLNYVGYAASAYALLICCCNGPRMIRNVRSTLRKLPPVRKILDSWQYQRFVSDPMYRAEVALYAGLVINLAYPKKTFSRAQLMDEFWGVDSDTSLRAVDVYITKLRDKFSVCDGFKIVTVRGLGYKAVLE